MEGSGNAGDKITSLDCVMKDCDPDVFPNIHTLLRIACSLPVTSADNERSKNVLKRFKSYLRSTMGSARLSALALMQIHRSSFVNFDKAVCCFAQLHPRRMLLSNPVFDIKRSVSKVWQASLTTEGAAWLARVTETPIQGKKDGPYLAKLARRLMSTFGIMLTFEKVRVPSLGYEGRVRKPVCC